MKVKLKSSGEIVDVEKKGEYYIDKDNNVYRTDEIEEAIIDIDEEDFKERFIMSLTKEYERFKKQEKEEEERMYWRDVRKEILIELINLKYLFHDVTKSDLVAEADMFVKLLKLKDVCIMKMKKKNKQQQIDDINRLFALNLTNKNQYLVHLWERNMHYNAIIEACKWGENVK